MGAIIPEFGDDFVEYIPWLGICIGLVLFAGFQVYAMVQIEKQHRGTILGLNRDGVWLHKRVEVAKWNQQVRDYCRRHQLRMVRADGGVFDAASSRPPVPSEV